MIVICRNLLLAYIGGTQNARPHLQKVNLHHITRKKYYLNIGLLRVLLKLQPPDH